MASAIRLAGSHLRELRIHLCQKSPASAGVRAFIESDYVGLKQANPQFPILIRECSGIVPRVFARCVTKKFFVVLAIGRQVENEAILTIELANNQLKMPAWVSIPFVCDEYLMEHKYEHGIERCVVLEDLPKEKVASAIRELSAMN
ncbi:hypothetical protein ANCCEY_01191 [Ancylostoma ceylanicum]|uniref:NADH dehydrogenase [ubiquinone] 1 alpha subcomplex subunit 2 n=1 Tax=Ancylostoma ceylanicum TaxID=53326 RepID=A0A0D6MCX0_9BILA|nr:hypothetical protein ANCCEY_01191 [Ancylostoma ceylanicum]